MRIEVMVTISGDYQLDLIQLLTSETLAVGGNWQKSKIGHIDNYFSGLIKIEIDNDNVQALVEAFKKHNFNVEVRELESLAEYKHALYTLKVKGKDKPGLVNQIWQVLNESGFELDSMDCHRFGVSDISGTIFTGIFAIRIEGNTNTESMILNIEKISTDLLVSLKKVS